MTPALQAWFTAVASLAGFSGIVIAVLARRKTNADADFSYGGAWEKFVTSQDRALDGAKKDVDRLGGRLEAANQRILILERQRNEALFWQAQITARESIVAAVLQEKGISVPAMPSPPVVREAYTRADDIRSEEP